MANPLKSKPYQLKAAYAYTKRKKEAGYITYTRLIKKEWKEKLDDLLILLRKEGQKEET